MKTSSVLTLPPEMAHISWPEKIEFLFQHQLETWKMARVHYQHFTTIKKRELWVGKHRFIVQHNAARVRSTCADPSKAALGKRPCFLCSKNIDTDQKGLIALKKYLILINPFPIFSRHLTLADIQHKPQRIASRMIDMLELAALLEEFTVFYNGPLCGASAPDHFHFQAVPNGIMPLEIEIDTLHPEEKEIVFEKEDLFVYTLRDGLQQAIVVESGWKEPIDYFFAKLLKVLPNQKEAGEPLLNCMAMYANDRYRLLVFPRETLRPACFFLEDPERIIVSPASAELGGILVIPREEDYSKLTPEVVKGIFSDVLPSPTVFEKMKEDIVKLL
ncbi:MAG TPA: DUF4922 domain-containing protein [Prolixibacteraceae bacterium]|nr:DUF4922 domain-containing protein [Prolixibacteraceae bacterium]